MFLTRTWRSIRLRVQSTTGNHFAGSIALLPAFLLHPGKKDMSLGGVTERAVELRLLHIAVVIAWGGAWASCRRCKSSVNDQIRVRFGLMFQNVLCTACEDLKEDEDSAKFNRETGEGNVEMWPLCDEADLSAERN